uniref:Uncharacterized protein n=1 Tax=Sarcoptes scabiei TaxID=52283 RepID=A0A834VCL9_SARSC
MIVNIILCGGNCFLIDDKQISNEKAPNPMPFTITNVSSEDNDDDDGDDSLKDSIDFDQTFDQNNENDQNLLIVLISKPFERKQSVGNTTLPLMVKTKVNRRWKDFEANGTVAATTTPNDDEWLRQNSRLASEIYRNNLWSEPQSSKKILISISCTNTERDGLVLDQRQQQTRTVVISKSFDDKPPCYDEALSQ